MELKNKVALITGAASGIGESTALWVFQRGAKLILTDLDKGVALMERINRDGGEAVFVKADVSVPQDSEKSVEKAMDEFGRQKKPPNPLRGGNKSKDAMLRVSGKKNKDEIHRVSTTQN